MRTTIRLDRNLSSDEMQRVRQGLVPVLMEDKWFIFWEDDTLFFHRSWTGFCIYVVHFTTDDNSCRMVDADVNRDPAQYRGVSDDQDAKLISYLVDALILRQEAMFPSDEPSPGKRALMEWSLVGRAMLGKHPNDTQ
jgi:hypothetical protein